jgi:hypothetical protein
MAEREHAPILGPSLSRAGLRGLVAARPFACAGMLGATGIVMAVAAPVTMMIRLNGITAFVGGVRMGRAR